MYRCTGNGLCNTLYVCVCFRIQRLKKETIALYKQYWLLKKHKPYIVSSLEISVSIKLLKPPVFFSGLTSSVVKYENNTCLIGLLGWDRLLYKKGPIRCLKVSTQIHMIYINNKYVFGNIYLIIHTNIYYIK